MRRNALANVNTRTYTTSTRRLEVWRDEFHVRVRALSAKIHDVERIGKQNPCVHDVDRKYI